MKLLRSQRISLAHIIVHYGGRDWVLGELAEYYKISPYVLYNRIKRGWPLEEALFKKVV